MEGFTEYYRLRYFALNTAAGDFSYLWYNSRCTMLIRSGLLFDHSPKDHYVPNCERATYHAGY